MQDDGLDPWTVLGIDRDCTRKELKSAFKRRLLTAHPDGGGSTEEFYQLQRAYKTALAELKAGVPERSGEGGAHQAWNINDFFRWRREQAKEEHARWQKDADFASQWPGSWRRLQEEEAREEEKRQLREVQEARLQELLRNSQSRYSGQTGRARSRDGRMISPDMHRSDWAEFLARRNEGQEAKPPRPAVHEEDRGRTVVSYRRVQTKGGSVRVPVYQSASGERYYRSLSTSKKVTLPG